MGGHLQGHEQGVHGSASPNKWSEEQQKPPLAEHPQEAALAGAPKEHNMQHVSGTPDTAHRGHSIHTAHEQDPGKQQRAVLCPWVQREFTENSSA